MSFITKPNSMGSEIIIDALRFIVSATRPRKIVEFGLGQTTVCLLKMLQELDEVFVDNEAMTAGALDLIDYKDNPVDDLRFVGIDIGTGKWSEYPNLMQEISTYPFVQVFESDYKCFLANSLEKWDLAIVDLGRPSDNLILVNALVDRLNDGGFVLLHEPIEMQAFISEGVRYVDRGYSIVWNLLKTCITDDFEVITVPESHKLAQAGVGILRKKCRHEMMRFPTALKDELFAVQDVAATNLPNFRHLYQSSTNRFINILNNRDFLLVIGCLLDGVTSVSDIVQRTSLKAKSVMKYLSYAEDFGFNPRCSRPFGNLLSNGIPIDVLRGEKIVNYSVQDCRRLAEYFFLPDVIYSEHEVNWCLSHIQSDFAELRRKLVDLKFLKRDDHSRMYWRNNE